MKGKINFNYKTEFRLNGEERFRRWILEACRLHGFTITELNYVFCQDDYLLALNKEYLNHYTLTDIITFDYVEGKNLVGDIFISVERVRENAEVYGEEFEKELVRVMGHGVLHLMGYGDKEEKEVFVMRKKEEELIELFHVEQ